MPSYGIKGDPSVEQGKFLKNKLYLALLGSFLGLYLVQMILSLAGVRGNALVYVLAVLFALSAAGMLAVGYLRRQHVLLTVTAVYGCVQVLLFLLSIPGMITGKDSLPLLVEKLLFVPGYGLAAGGYLWRWAFALYWGVIFFGALEATGRELGRWISSWFSGLFHKKNK